MVEIPQYVFDEIIKFLLKNKKIYSINFSQSLNNMLGAKKTVHWLLNLPATKEEYFNQFSSKHRYNLRYYKKKLEENYNCEWKYFSEKDIDENLIKEFFELKKQKLTIYYDTDAKGFLSDYYKITDAFALYINGKMQAITLYSIIDSEVAYCENMAHDLNLSKYNTGNIIFYNSIENLIERGIKKIYLGGGYYDYKKNSKAIMSNTFCYHRITLNLWQKIFTCFVENIPQKRLIVILFGIKMTFKL